MPKCTARVRGEITMKLKTAKDALHLPSLSVRGLRGIDSLSIAELGYVTLIAGKNGVGKTTLLDAVRIYAAGGSYQVLTEMLSGREELAVYPDEDGDEVSSPNFETLFHGRHPTSDSLISIGPADDTKQLRITAGSGLLQYDAFYISQGGFLDDDEPILEVEFENFKQTIPFSSLRGIRASRRWMLQNRKTEGTTSIRYLTLGPSVPDNDDIAQFWDKVVLTDDELRAVQALRLIYGDNIERVAVVADESRPRYYRRVLVSTKEHDLPVPLRSLGDGAVRLFGVALALANSAGGFLMIDEVENGIHYSLQRDFWKMVMETAHQNDVQVFATTHSWDCVEGFNEAAKELEYQDGKLVTLTRRGEALFATTLEGRELDIAVRNRIEVR